MPREVNPLTVSRVIGDIIDHFTPTTDLRVYIDGDTICNGYRLRQSQVASRPRVEIGGQDFRILHTLVSISLLIYTFFNLCFFVCVCIFVFFRVFDFEINSILKVLVDADSPSPGNPYLREYLHWSISLFLSQSLTHSHTLTYQD